MAPNSDEIPTLVEIHEARERLGKRILETPVWKWRGREMEEAIGQGTEVFFKLEFLQYSGTFKPRGALLNMLELDAAALDRGVTAVSAGNHAIAVAYAARALGTTAKVVMLSSANPARVDACRSYGAEVVPIDDVHDAFDEVRRIEREEGRAFIHPFEGFRTALGTATLGLELAVQAPNLDAVIVPIGGGGLCAGVATAMKLVQPECRVFGIEPEGADTMHRSFEAGEPRSIDKVRTFADSLGAPHAAPYSFGLCQQFVDELVKITDDQMRTAMRLLFDSLKIGVEPAGAAATAALCGPLRPRLTGQRVGVIICGSNIDIATFAAQAGI
ncbi:MAG: threonine/serine dehydratase [Acidobacteriota bacterium]